MGGALATAVRKGNREIAILLADNDTPKRDALCEILQASAATAEEIATECDVFFLGVKPQGMKGLLEQIGCVLAKRNPAPIPLPI